MFAARFPLTEETTILDLGGTPATWGFIDIPARVTLLNLGDAPRSTALSSNLQYVQADATAIPFRDRSYDIVFSNSVIEHLYSLDAQQRFAKEASRVGRWLWIQTPAREFPIEPHFVAPVIHYFPRKVQRRLVRNFTPWGWLARPTQEQVDGLVDEIRLLTGRELKEFFPDCTIIGERFLGITKSHIAVRGP